MKDSEPKDLRDSRKSVPVQIISGDCYITNKPEEVLMTILGSCIAACVRDPVLQIGGMNHFLLPSSSDNEHIPSSEDAKYGVHAMELLINKLLKEGAVKSRLEVKVFGGGNINPVLGSIGNKNVEFIKKFLNDDGFKITSQDLGGNMPRKIHYYPCSGKVLVREVKAINALEVVRKEQEYLNTISTKSHDNDIELF